VALQGLMLPVNYGILVADKTSPRVANVGGSEDMAPGQEAWLVWEGKESITYLVRNCGNKKEVRELVTFLRSEVEQIRIIDYNPILRVLFAESSRCAPPQAESEKREHQSSHTSP
jgi:hypothetical protein